MASMEDIAAMKINSMLNRGSKKDYYEIYELLNYYSLKDLLDFYKSKYNFSSELIVIKSLIYFEDADQEPDPKILKSVFWNEVKNKLNEEMTKAFNV